MLDTKCLNQGPLLADFLRRLQFKMHDSSRQIRPVHFCLWAVQLQADTFWMDSGRKTSPAETERQRRVTRHLAVLIPSRPSSCLSSSPRQEEGRLAVTCTRCAPPCTRTEGAIHNSVPGRGHLSPAPYVKARWAAACTQQDEARMRLLLPACEWWRVRPGGGPALLLLQVQRDFQRPRRDRAERGAPQT